MISRYLDGVAGCLGGALLAHFLALPAPASTILGGKPVDISAAPWQMLQGDCGASWIGKNWVVTAHHCVEDLVANPSNAYWWAGITLRSEATDAIRIPARKIHVHPDQKPRSAGWPMNMDLALVELSRDVTAAKARPIRLITRAQAQAGLEKAGAAALVSGFGRTGGGPFEPLALQLQALETRIGNGDPQRPNYITIRQTNTGVCKGDSGGPLCVKDENGQWILAGAASHTTGGYCGGAEGQEDFFARVSAHLDWIHSITGPLPVGVDPAHQIAPRIGLAFEAGRLVFRAAEAGEVRLAVHDLSGKTLFRERIRLEAGVPYPAWNPAAGTYLVKAEGAGFRHVELIKAPRLSY